MAVTEIASGLKFPEGPVVMADGSIILVEIQAGKITRVKPDGKKQTIAKTGGGPNGAAIGPDGALYVCNNGGFAWAKRSGILLPGHKPADYSGGRIERVDISSGKVEVLYDACEGEKLRGPNDIVFDEAGGFWFTDHAKSTHDHREWGALYYAKADGSMIQRVIGSIMGPNGVGLSPDGKTVYYAETLSGRLMSVTLQRKNGSKIKSGGGLIPGSYVGSGPGFAYFDSLAVQADGSVCVATLLNSGITTISPKGKVTHTAIPKDPLVTNIAFGGKGLKTAYITLSGTGKLISMPWPKAGLRLAYNA